MMTSIIVLAVFLNIAHSFIDSYRIEKKKSSSDPRDINHTIGALIYTGVCVGCALLFANIWYVIPMLFIRPVVFDPLLNIQRKPKLHPFHVSPTTTSVIDQWEIKLLGTNGFIHWLVWLGLSVVSIVVLNLVK